MVTFAKGFPSVQYTSAPSGPQRVVKFSATPQAIRVRDLFVFGDTTGGDFELLLPPLGLLGPGHAITVEAYGPGKLTVTSSPLDTPTAIEQLTNTVELEGAGRESITFVREVDTAISQFWRVVNQSSFPDPNPTGPEIVEIDVSGGDAQAVLPLLADVDEGKAFTFIVTGIGGGTPSISAAPADFSPPQPVRPLDDQANINNLSAFVPQSLTYQKRTIAGAPRWVGTAFKQAYSTGLGSPEGATPDVPGGAFAHVQELSPGGTPVLTPVPGSFVDWTTGAAVNDSFAPYCIVVGSNIEIRDLGPGYYRLMTRTRLTAPAGSAVTQRIIQGIGKTPVSGTITVPEASAGAPFTIESHAVFFMGLVNNPLTVQWASDNGGGVDITVFSVDFIAQRIGT